MHLRVAIHTVSPEQKARIAGHAQFPLLINVTSGPTHVLMALLTQKVASVA